MYINPQLLDMARANALAHKEGRDLPYKPPYKYLDSDKNEREADPEWFDHFVKNFYGQTSVLPTNELSQTE